MGQGPWDKAHGTRARAHGQSPMGKGPWAKPLGPSPLGQGPKKKKISQTSAWDVYFDLFMSLGGKFCTVYV